MRETSVGRLAGIGGGVLVLCLVTAAMLNGKRARPENNLGLRSNELPSPNTGDIRGGAWPGSVQPAWVTPPVHDPLRLYQASPQLFWWGRAVRTNGAVRVQTVIS